MPTPAFAVLESRARLGDYPFMQRLLLLLVACIALLSALRAGEVVVIPIKGEISKAQFFFLRRGLKDAEAAKADAVILDMDTYGGELSAATDMIEALLEHRASRRSPISIPMPAPPAH